MRDVCPNPIGRTAPGPRRAEGGSPGGTRGWVLLLVSALAFTGSSSRATESMPVRAGSYAAEGECLCLVVPPELARRIRPTPVGGQSVGQICRGLGRSPALRVIDGVPNYPTYADVQCGHGPAPRGETLLPDCGEADAEEGSCVARGPRWNLDRVYRLDASRSAGGSSGKPSITEATVSPERFPADAPPEPSGTARVGRRDERAPPPGDRTARASTAPSEASREPTVRPRNEMDAPADGDDGERPAVRLARAPGAEPVVIVAETTPSDPALVAGDVWRSAAATPAAADVAIATVSGTRRPGAIERPERYLELAAVGAADGRRGVSVGGSAGIGREGMPLALQFRLGAADEWRELRLGAGLRVRPSDAKRLSVALAAGLEVGIDEGESEDPTAAREDADTGLYLRAASGIDVGARLRLSGGMEVTTRFDGGYRVFGAALLRLSSALGVFTRVQDGDTERVRLGLRYER